jgi:hypothetical protein
MANRYYVGGTGDWHDTAHWSTTSGGSSGASIPTSSDDVFINASSGFGAGGTIGFSTDDIVFHDITANSGHSWTITDGGGWNIRCYGSIVLESTATISNHLSIQGTGTIQTNGADFTVYFTIQGNNTLAGNLVTGVDIDIQNATFDANDFNITARTIAGYYSTVYMGSGVWETLDYYNAMNDWSFIFGDGITVYPETSTVKLSGTSTAFDSNYTFYNVWLNTTGSYIKGNNTFNDIKITGGKSVKFTTGNRQIINTFTPLGSSGNLVTIDSTNGSDPFYLFKPTGVVGSNYLDLSNSNTEPDMESLFESFGDYNEQQWLLTQEPGQGYIAYAQSFTGNGQRMYSAGYLLTKTGSPTGNVQAKIYAHTGTFGSGKPVGSPIAVSNLLDASTLDGTPDTYYLFTFSGENRVVLENGVNYCISIEHDNPSYTDVVSISINSTSKTMAGNLSYPNGDGSWTAIDSAEVILSISSIPLSATWYAGRNSIDNGGNTGWIFGGPLSPLPSFYQS